MTIIMDIAQIKTIEQMEKFLTVDEEFVLSVKNKEEFYDFLRNILITIKYFALSKKNKGIVIKYIKKISKYSDKQIKRLIKKYKSGNLKWKTWQKNTFKKVYDHNDIALLHWLDKVLWMSWNASQKILQREYEIFWNKKYENISKISVAHIYNLRKLKSYIALWDLTFDKTKYTPVNIGERTKPEPNNKPWYFRVDTVHQWDLNGIKWLYHINFVDEILQFEFVFSVPAISEKYMKQVLEMMYTYCPYEIINFHSDNWSEYINQFVADWLQRLHIKQTKSRARRHNDNALVESKNGSVIRKHIWYFHIPATEYNASIMNSFFINTFNLFLNYHRPCAYAKVTIDNKWKQKKEYDTYDTPYERLKSLPNAEKYLKRNFSFKILDKIAYSKSDVEFIENMNKIKKDTFKSLNLKNT